MSSDSSHTYVHLLSPHHADLFEAFTQKSTLPQPDEIFVPQQYQPPNPEDEDDVVPDQHAAFGIQRATMQKREPVWRDLGLKDLLERGPKEGEQPNNLRMMR